MPWSDFLDERSPESLVFASDPVAHYGFGGPLGYGVNQVSWQFGFYFVAPPVK